MTIVDPWAGPEEKLIGQVWEYMLPGSSEPDHYHFSPRRLPEFEGFPFESDGRNTRPELLEIIKCKYAYLKRAGLISDQAKLMFSLLPVEQVF